MATVAKPASKFAVGQIVASRNGVMYQIKAVREDTPKGMRYSVMRVDSKGKCFGPYRNLFDNAIKAVIEATVRPRSAADDQELGSKASSI
jgi:hypothetical protein